MPGVTRNTFLTPRAATDEEGHPFENEDAKMNLEEDFVIIGQPLSEHAWKTPDIISTKMFLDVSIKLLMTSVRQLIRLNLMTFLL